MAESGVDQILDPLMKVTISESEKKDKLVYLFLRPESKKVLRGYALEELNINQEIFEIKREDSIRNDYDTKKNQFESDLKKSKNLYEYFERCIFYVGKGDNERPYKHLSESKCNILRTDSELSDKDEHLLTIWKRKKKVIVLIPFKNISELYADFIELCIIKKIRKENKKEGNELCRNNLTNKNEGSKNELSINMTESEIISSGKRYLQDAFAVFLKNFRPEIMKKTSETIFYEPKTQPHQDRKSLDSYAKTHAAAFSEGIELFMKALEMTHYDAAAFYAGINKIQKKNLETLPYDAAAFYAGIILMIQIRGDP